MRRETEVEWRRKGKEEGQVGSGEGRGTGGECRRKGDRWGRVSKGGGGEWRRKGDRWGGRRKGNRWGGRRKGDRWSGRVRRHEGRRRKGGVRSG